MSKKLIKNIEETFTHEDFTSSEIIIPSGADLLDLCLSGGYRAGKIVNFVGPESTGKTLFAIEAIFAAKKKFGNKLKDYYDDSESGFSFNLSDMYGSNFINLAEDPSTRIEEFDYNIDKQLSKTKKDEILFYVLDCLDALSSDEEKERHDTLLQIIETDSNKKPSGSYEAEKSKKLKRSLRINSSLIKEKNSLLFIISQVIYNLSKYGPMFTRTGGKGLDHYSSQVIWSKNAEKLERKDVVIGERVKLEVKKNKFGPCFKTCFIDLFYDYGIDNVGSNVNYLYDLLTPEGKLRKKEAKKIIWDDVEYSRENLISYIEKEGKETDLKNRVFKKWNDFELSIANNDRKRKIL